MANTCGTPLSNNTSRLPLLTTSPASVKMIHLYAEHLLNIRTLSIQASLSTASNKETKATLAADRSIFTLSHEGESASIRLPINLSPCQESTVKLTIPAVSSKQLSFRLRLEEEEGVTNSVLNSCASDDGNVVPWTAASLTPQTEISCRACESVLVSRGTISGWKDLPSEGWAEMMDFWHCHKPDEPHGHDHTQSKKGYSAAGQLALQPGVGMVGTMDLLFAAGDCEDIEEVSSSTNGADANIILHCIQCGHVLGHARQSNESYQLRKAQLSVSTSPEQSPRTYDPEKWFACHLLTAMETQGSRKFIAQEENPNPEFNKALRLWIFTPDLLISSSRKMSTDYTRVCKIMWQDCQPPDEHDSKPLTSTALAEGELRLQLGELASLRHVLQETSIILPEEARTFQGWQVALLERFTFKDLE